MSGICGAWSFDGGDPGLDPTLALLERRGPDGTHVWAGGPVALGHTLLATTPEALVEVLPLTDADSGCTITADARIDNRDELIAALDLGGETRTIGDGELILRAYFRWGEECPKHLLGDFAFAIWDPREERLFCARDHMGMRQLIYHHAPGKLFAFATEADALVAHAGVAKRINEARIADFLEGMEGIDLTSTFFQDILRLPPAHHLTVTDRGASLRRYWRLELPPELKLGSDEAYAAAFLEVFNEAVRCRLRSAGPVGATLSGGIDSNSVAAIAATMLAEEGRGPLNTFSGCGPDPHACTETHCILVAMANPDFIATSIDYRQLCGMRDELLQLFSASAEPFDCDMNIVRAVDLLAHRKGIKVLLDGLSADVVLTAGNQVAQLLRRCKLPGALFEARINARYFHPDGLLRILLASTWSAFAPERIRGLKRRFFHWTRNPSSRLTVGFANRVNLLARRQEYASGNPSARPTDRAYRLQMISHPHNVAARERYDRVAAALAIEPRDPFFDRRVVEFCLSLPSAQLRSEGWPKWVLRRAMAGIVPDAICWRRSKEHLGFAFTTSLFSAFGEPRVKWENINASLSDYVSCNRQEEESWGTQAFVELFSLASWLSRQHVAGGSNEARSEA